MHSDGIVRGIETVLRVEGLKVLFGGGRVVALDEISLSFGAGTVTGLIGPNGAGKSTLLRVMGGLLPPDRGKVWREGRIGFVPDQPGTYHLSGYEWMTALGRMEGLGRKEAAERANSLLEEFRIGAVRGRPVVTYSRGMRQRFLLAQAMLGDPAILLMDEPSAGLDPFGMEELAGVIEQFREEGRTIVMTSHQTGEVEEICDRVVLMGEGRIVEDTSPTSIRERYGSLAAGYRDILGRERFR